MFDPKEGWEDWSEDFDDMGPEDWEDYLGGPDDEYFENYF